MLSKVSSARVVVSAILAVLLAGGCSASPHASDPPLVPQQSPSASPLLNTLERTKTLGTARIDVTVTRGDSTLIGSGAVDLAKGLGQMTWHDAQGWRTQLDNDRGTFVRTGAWRRTAATAQSPLADPLALLGRMRVLSTSTVSCSTSPCTPDQGTPDQGTRYQGTLPVTPAARAAMGYPTGEPPPAAITVTVEVDAGGRIIAVTRTAVDPVGAATVRMRVSLHDFSGPLVLTSPTLAAP